MRLIDADAIPYVKTMYTVGLLDMVTRFTIDTMPTIDAVPVIRCKDCKWSYKDENTPICGYRGFFVNESFYCADGKRKDDKDDPSHPFADDVMMGELYETD